MRRLKSLEDSEPLKERTDSRPPMGSRSPPVTPGELSLPRSWGNFSAQTGRGCAALHGIWRERPFHDLCEAVAAHQKSKPVHA